MSVLVDRKSLWTACGQSLFPAREGDHAAELHLCSHSHDGKKAKKTKRQDFVQHLSKANSNVTLLPSGAGLEHHVPQLADLRPAALGLPHLDPTHEVPLPMLLEEPQLHADDRTFIHLKSSVKWEILQLNPSQPPENSAWCLNTSFPLSSMFDPSQQHQD